MSRALLPTSRARLAAWAARAGLVARVELTEWFRRAGLAKMVDPLGLASRVGWVGRIGRIGLVPLVGMLGQTGLIGLTGLTGLTGLVGCSLVVTDELEGVACTTNGRVGAPACASGEVCISQKCVACHRTEHCGDKIDDNCNGEIDEGCAGGASGTGGTGGASGTSGAAGTGGAGQKGLGEACETDAECTDGLCFPWSDFTETREGKFCTKPCCSSGVCGDVSKGAVCHPTPSGASVCVQGAEFGRSDLGAGLTGTSCMIPADCRSGWCDDGLCNDVCCNNNACQSSQAPECGKVSFTLGSVPPRDAFVCGTAAGIGSFLTGCESDNDCRSATCFLEDDSHAFYCSKTCCNSDDCGEFNGLAVSCLYARKTSTSTFVRACASLATDSGTLKPTGSTCMDHTDCRSDRCLHVDGQPGYCSDTCCSDADCGDPGLKLKCVPVNPDGTTTPSDDLVLRCAKVD